MASSKEGAMEASNDENRQGRRHRLLEILADLCIERPKQVLVAAAVLTLVAVTIVVALRIQIVTDRGALVSSDEPAQVRYREVSEMLGSLSLAVIVFGGEDRESLRTAATEMAAELEGDEQVRSAFYQLDMGYFHNHALLFLDEGQLECVEFAMGPIGLGSMGSSDGETGLMGLVTGIQSGIETASADTELPEQCRGVNPLVLMNALFREVGVWAEDPEHDSIDILSSVELPSSGASPGEYGVDDQGYMIERSGSEPAPNAQGDEAQPHLVFMLIQPTSSSGDEAVARALTESLRARARPIAEANGVTVGVTGMPAIITDEMDAVHRDIKACIASAIVFVLLLFLATFRSLRATALVMVPLILGLVWTAGFTAVVYRQLTMVSVYFAAVLFGLGIAFGIHIIARFDEGLRAGKPADEALRYAMLGAGPGVITGGVTTAAAFLAVGFVEFQGFAQLGIVAGAGVLLMLVGSLTAFPVCLLYWRGKPLPEPKAREWLGKVGNFLARHAVPITVAAVLLSAAGAWGGSRITFDYDFSKLLPSEAEALRYYRLMEARSDISSDVAISTATSPAEAEQLRLRFEQLDTVARAEAVTKYLPGTSEEQARRVERLAKIGEKALEPLTKIRDRARIAAGPDQRVEPAALADALEELADTIEDAWFAAQQTGRSEAPDLARFRDTVRTAAVKVKGAPSERATERLTALQHKMFDGMATGADVVIANLQDPEAMTPESLPEDVRRRFVVQQPDGSNLYVVYAFPTGRVGNREFLDEFYDQITGVDPNVTGFPVTHYFHGELARKAFFQAVAYAAIAVLLLLIVDYRKPRYIILASIPLVVGATWAVGTMALLGWHWNFVNVIALPLVLGAGVDFGVHLVHRFKQEGTASAALRTTGRPVILSAVTTLVGMGGLALAEHRGAASLGWILVVGIGSCLLSASLVLPAVMALWTRDKHKS